MLPDLCRILLTSALTLLLVSFQTNESSDEDEEGKALMKGSDAGKEGKEEKELFFQRVCAPHLTDSGFLPPPQ